MLRMKVAMCRMEHSPAASWTGLASYVLLHMHSTFLLSLYHLIIVMSLFLLSVAVVVTMTILHGPNHRKNSSTSSGNPPDPGKQLWASKDLRHVHLTTEKDGAWDEKDAKRVGGAELSLQGLKQEVQRIFVHQQLMYELLMSRSLFPLISLSLSPPLSLCV